MQQKVSPETSRMQSDTSAIMNHMMDQKNESILSYRRFISFIPFNAMLLLSIYMSLSFQAGYGAAWFAGCKTIQEDNHCDKELDYDTYNFYTQISNSVTGAVAFLCAALVGCLTDTYGPKVFLYFQLFTSWIPFIPMLFYNNFYLYLALVPIKGLNGSAMTITPAQNAYITRVLPTNKRLTGFSLMYAIGTLTLVMGTGLAFFVSYTISDHFNYYIINVLFVINLVYLWGFVRAPQQKEDCNHIQKPYRKVRYNPFTPFKYLCNNSVCLWISLSSSFVVLQFQGTGDIEAVVFNNVLHSSESQSNVVFMIQMCSMTVGCVIGFAVILPLLKRYRVSEYKILICGLVVVMLNCLLMSLIFAFKHLWFIGVFAFISGVASLSFPTYTSLLTAHCDDKEIGMALGVMFSCNAVMSIIAPLGFAAVYRYLRDRHMEFCIFFLSFILAFIAFLFALPLRFAMFKQSQAIQKRDQIAHENASPLLEPDKMRLCNWDNR